ncbi:MAG: hypothetical protein AAGC55_20790, partial [Myxococcota bacterium]
VDARSDLYTLGVILFEMLSGRLPFLGAGMGEFIFAHISQPAPPVDSINPSVSAEVTALVARLLTKAPDERYSSADELIAALDELMPSAGRMVTGPLGDGQASSAATGTCAAVPLRIATEPSRDPLAMTPGSRAGDTLVQRNDAAPTTTPLGVRAPMARGDTQGSLNMAIGAVEGTDGPAATGPAVRKAGARRWWIAVGLLAGCGCVGLLYTLGSGAPGHAPEEDLTAAQLTAEVAAETEYAPVPTPEARPAAVGTATAADEGSDSDGDSATNAVSAADTASPAGSEAEAETELSVASVSEPNAPADGAPNAKSGPTADSAGRTANRSGRPSEAEAQRLLDKAQEHYYDGEYDLARHLYSRVARGPHSADRARLGMAQVDLSKKNYRSARDIAHGLVRRNSNSHHARKVLADALRGLGDHATARLHYGWLCQASFLKSVTCNHSESQ